MSKSAKKLKYRLVEFIDLINVNEVSGIGEFNQAGIRYASGPVPVMISGNDIVMLA